MLTDRKISFFIQLQKKGLFFDLVPVKWTH